MSVFRRVAQLYGGDDPDESCTNIYVITHAMFYGIVYSKVVAGSPSS